MKTKLFSKHVSALIIATTLAVTIPGVSHAGFFTKAKSRIQAVKANLSHSALIEKVKQFHLLEQLNETIALVQHRQAEYQSFTGGSGCGADCAVFREDLKNVTSNFLYLAQDIPALNANGALINNLQRGVDIIDFIPPRALFLMWQKMNGQVTQMQNVVDEIRQSLAPFPQLESVSMAADGTASNTSGSQDSGICAWVEADNKPKLDLLQARLEMFAWRLHSAADIIPDVEVKAAAGASVGAEATAGVGLKPTDEIKIILKVIAYIPERINWAIKINELRAKVACQMTN